MRVIGRNVLSITALSAAALLGCSNNSVDNSKKAPENPGITKVEKSIDEAKTNEIKTPTPAEQLTNEIKTNGKSIEQAFGEILDNARFILISTGPSYFYADSYLTNKVTESLKQLKEKHGLTHIFITSEDSDNVKYLLQEADKLGLKVTRIKSNKVYSNPDITEENAKCKKDLELIKSTITPSDKALILVIPDSGSHIISKKPELRITSLSDETKVYPDYLPLGYLMFREYGNDVISIQYAHARKSVLEDFIAFDLANKPIHFTPEQINTFPQEVIVLKNTELIGNSKKTNYVIFNPALKDRD